MLNNKSFNIINQIMIEINIKLVQTISKINHCLNH